MPEVDCNRNHMQVGLNLSDPAAHSNCTARSDEEGPVLGLIDPIQLVGWYHSPHNMKKQEEDTHPALNTHNQSGMAGLELARVEQN